MTKELEIPADGSIPKFLARGKPTEENKARIAAIVAEGKNPTIKLAEPTGERRDWLRPKGMSDEDWKKYQEAEATKKKAATTERLKGLKKERQPKRPARDGLISVGDIAKKAGLLPREARAILRSAKEPKPACGWAFDTTTAGRIEGLLRAGAAKAPPKGTPGTKPTPKGLSIPPPEETTWSLSKKDKKKWKTDVKKRDVSMVDAEAAEAKTAPKKRTLSKAATARKK
jgi:hypothetical protein